MDFLLELNGHGQAIVLITHDHKLVCRYAQRVLFLEDGRISVRAPTIEPSIEIDLLEDRLHEVHGA
jgi:energy-coupling factor transporter ATP-binding protein EcfA2